MSHAEQKAYDSDRKEGERGFTTLQLKHGQPLDAQNRARAPPIYQSTSFCFKDSAHGAGLFALQQLGPIYTRKTSKFDFTPRYLFDTTVQSYKPKL